MTWGKIFLFLFFSVAIAFTSEQLLVDPNYNYGFQIFAGRWPALIAICLATYPIMDAQAQVHAKKIARNIYISHWGAWLFRAAIGIGLASLYHCFNYNLWRVVELALFDAGWMGIVFDFRLNRYRGEEPLYVGQRDKKKDSLREKIFRRWRLGGLLLLILEISWMVVWGWIYAT